ncbi:MAG: hypothetical protein CFE28_00295 [Alphaproteobacteria bacterium PA2]|nr:MAG: hypothetical protein CFE28_00295 [Alphaproteobacteria bacterium PA2]
MFHTLITRHEAAPEKVMMKVGDQAYTYGRMIEQIARCTTWLKTLNLRPGSRALLYVTNPYSHWILTFALERVGVTSCAVSVPEAVIPSLDYLQAETLFTRTPPAQPVGQAVHLIDQAWFNMLAALTPAPVDPPPRSPDDILRIIVTSGTTGEAKKIPLTRAVVEARIRNAQAGGYYTRPDLKMAATFALSAVAGWIHALYCFNEGGMLVSGKPWADLITSGEVNLFRLAPANLQALLADLPADFAPPPDLRLSIVGGSLSPALAERAARRLTPDILVNYGATETGTVVMGLIAELDRPDAAGFICPWATVGAVDPEGRPVPADQVGEIRIRSDNLCAGYLEDPQATAAMFRDGWFWPGDLGQISEDGRLAIVGRTNDLMNIGGAKVLATRVEAVALTVAGVEDVAAFPGPGEDGLATAWVAYVKGPDLNVEALRERMTRALGRVPVMREVAAIPRNGMGKIQRDLLAGLV